MLFFYSIIFFRLYFFCFLGFYYGRVLICKVILKEVKCGYSGMLDKEWRGLGLISGFVVVLEI